MSPVTYMNESSHTHNSVMWHISRYCVFLRTYHGIVSVLEHYQVPILCLPSNTSRYLCLSSNISRFVSSLEHYQVLILCLFSSTSRYCVFPRRYHGIVSSLEQWSEDCFYCCS